MPEHVKAKGVHRPHDNAKPGPSGGGGGGNTGSPIGLLLLLTYS